MKEFTTEVLLKKMEEINMSRDKLTAEARKITKELNERSNKLFVENMLLGMTDEQKAMLQTVVASGIDSEENVNGLQ